MASSHPLTGVSVEPEQIEGVDLEAFERAVYLRPKENRIEENNEATKALIQALRQLREGAGFAGHGGVNQPTANRMVSAIVALFADPGYNLTQTGFDIICSEKAALDSLFRASSYRSSDFFYTFLPVEERMPLKYLALYLTNSRLDWDLEAVFRDDPRGTVGLWLALIGYGQVLTKEAHERRERLLGMADIFKDVDLADELWNLVCSAYMHCSYATREDKHAIKGVIHSMVAKKLRSVVPTDFVHHAGKPRLMCVFEWWWTKHAMYRSYAHSVRQLREKFHMIGCCAGKNTDPEAKAIFDEWVELDGENMDLSKVVPQLHAKGAGIIYYPSIGMAIWVIALSSLRLAPIQVMSYGHPATSNSPEIDYGLIESDCLTVECFNEKMIGLPPGTVRPTAYTDIKVRHEPKDGDVVKIAIPAMQVKVSYPFIQAMQQVRSGAKKRVEFWFFSAAHGVGLEPMAYEIAQQLDGTWCQQQQQYEDYIESIASCDLALFSFPFGGANSCYDALTVGLPCVSLKGKQPHSMSDASILARFGLHDLITTSVDDYIAKIVELVNDPEKRAEVSRRVLEANVLQVHAEDESKAFVGAFEKLYEDANLKKMAA